MHLISCHIENFGKLHELDLTFSDGMNVFYRENGWGKSTLAAFIKAMLYGLDGNRKRGHDENERRKFAPWQGGVFGGSMVFEANGIKYAVTRTFGDSPAKDSFELRNGSTNLISHDFSERLGEELFRLNSASFARSIFIGQNDCQTSSTDDIHAKIGNLADNTGDINSFESADEKLRKQINSLSPKLRTGSLFKLSAEISELRRRVADGVELSEIISECESKTAEAEKQKLAVSEKRRALETEQKRAVRLNDLAVQKGEFIRLKKNHDSLKSELESANAKFPRGIPDGESIRECMHSVVEMKSAESLMNSYQLSEHEERRLEELSALFAEYTPSADEIDMYLARANELQRIRQKYDRLKLTDEEQHRFDILFPAFEHDKAAPDELMSQWNEYRVKKSSIVPKRTAYSAYKASFDKTRKKHKRRSVASIVTGCGLFALGIGLFFVFSDPVLFSVSVTGGLFIAAGIFFAVLINSQKPPAEMLRLETETERDEEFIDYAFSATVEYIESHGMLFDESDAIQRLQELCNEKIELEQLEKKSQKAEYYIRNSSFLDLTNSLTGFLNIYGISPDDGNMTEELHRLKESVSDYLSLSVRRSQYDDAETTCSEKQNLIEKFLESYGFEYGGNYQETLEQIRDSAAETVRLSESCLQAAAELSEFERTHDIGLITSPDNENLPSIESLNEEIRQCTLTMEELNDSIISLKQNLDELNKKYASWEEDSFALCEKTQKQASDKLRYERLLKTRELLRMAKESMTARYVAPIYESFRRYYSILAGDTPDSYRIDADVNLTVEELGRQRDIRSLSAGLRDLAGICLRIALADAMYRGEKPPLIMDDPFTNLDDEKVAASKALLSTASESYQIIYFTCSASRKAGDN